MSEDTISKGKAVHFTYPITTDADGNHPLAGKAITFHVTVKTIRDATAEDGLPEGMLH